MLRQRDKQEIRSEREDFVVFVATMQATPSLLITEILCHTLCGFSPK